MVCLFWFCLPNGSEFSSESLSRRKDEKFTGFFYLARRRKRVFHSLTTHVLVPCVVCADGTLALGQRRPFLFDFCTVWSVSRDVLLAGCGDLSLHALSVTEDTFSSVKPTIPARDSEFGIVVWPDVFRASRPVKPADAFAGLDGLRAVRRPGRKRVGGVGTLSPAMVLLLPAPGAAIAPRAVVKTKNEGSLRGVCQIT